MNNKKADTQQFINGVNNLPRVLRELGIDSLRKGQDEAIATLLSLRDCYTVLPTSHGKSLIFTVPTLCYNWKTIVFTPLVALMQDHLRNLRKKGLKAGSISSGQTNKENEMTLMEYARGDLNFLLIAPERLHNLKFNEAMRNQPPDMIAVDEAHVLSQWAIGFRSSYCKIVDFIKQFEPKVVLTLTATSPKEVEEDIINIIGLDKDVKKVIYLPPRLNLKLHSENFLSDYEMLKLVNSIEGSGIIYCSTVKRTHELFDALGGFIKGKALVYNGELSRNDKFMNQEAWTTGKVRVAICTNAFGLGINKPDTRFVIYRNMPGSIEELSQGFGRAGRDGKDAHCLMYFDDESIKTQEFFIDCGYPPKSSIVSIYNAIKANSDSDGICHISLSRLADMTKVNKFFLQAISHNLQAFRCIERTTKEKVLQAKIISDPDHDRYLKYYEALANYGSVNSAGWFEMDIEFMAGVCNTTETTLVKHLKYLDDQRFIKLVLPQARPPLKIIGPVSLVDFSYLVDKKNEAYKKLDSVMEFHRVKDKLKHTYIQEYFKQTLCKV